MQERASDTEKALERALALAVMVSKKSPTALTAFKRGLLQAMGQSQEKRSEIEALAYEKCVKTGEAAIGRRDFHLIKTGQSPKWNPKQV